MSCPIAETTAYGSQYSAVHLDLVDQPRQSQQVIFHKSIFQEDRVLMARKVSGPWLV